MLITLVSILPIVLGFGFLVFVHELGHFLAAKWAGIRTEAFAVGMGPVAVAWRRGLGFRVGSTIAERDRRVSAWLSQEAGHTGAEASPAAAPGIDDVIRAEAALGLGETEYSLRWLPIGGFVKMLGQDDLAPDPGNAHPKSYSRCPIPRRMVVVSAGVIMNLITAAIFFVVAFLVGVRFEAPIAGDSLAGSPAATSVAVNAAAAGVFEPGIRAGDRILTAGDRDVRTFNDLILAVAMSKPGDPFSVSVERPGIPEPLVFDLEPVLDPASRLRSVGVGLGRGPVLLDGDAFESALADLAARHPELSGLGPRARVNSVNGIPVGTWSEVVNVARAGDGSPLTTVWMAPNAVEGASLAITIPVEPEYETRLVVLPSPGSSGPGPVAGEPGLIGLVRPVVVEAVQDTSANTAWFRPGDVVARLNDVAWPGFGRFVQELQRSRGLVVEMDVIRAGRLETVRPAVDDDGRLGVMIRRLADTAMTAAPIDRGVGPEARYDPARLESPRASPTSIAGIPGGAIITAVDDAPVAGWAELRSALRAATAGPAAAATGTSVELRWRPPSAALTAGANPDGNASTALEASTSIVVLDPAEVATLQGLGWMPVIPEAFFDAPWVDLDAGGDPLTALRMGARETGRVVTMTYLTIDRLFRRSVGIDQLRGPVGIVDLGVQILPRGFMYLLFLLGMISVNLAVLNFLPLPIVDGGLFLYLIYEAITGRPPPVGFQNFATLLGLAGLLMLFAVTFYNDISRLI